MTRSSYLAVLGAAACCYAALGAVLRILPDVVPGHALLGLAVGAPALAALVTRPAGGRLADDAGPRRVLLAGAVAMAAGMAPALVSTATAPLVASRLLVGAGEGAMMSAAVLWLLRLAGEERRGRALGHIGLANYAGLTAGPLLADALDTTTTVLVAATVLPLAGGALAAGVDRPPRAARSHPRERSSGLLRAIAVPGGGLLLVNVGYAALLGFGTAATRAHGVGASALVVPVFAGGVIAARGLGASIPDRAGARRTLRWSTALAAAGLAGTAVARASVPALAAVAVLAAGQALAVPALGLLALRRVAPERHGAAAGTFFAFFDAGVGLGGPLAGLVANAGTPSVALLFAAVATGSARFAAARSPRTSWRGCRRRWRGGSCAARRTR